jgi:BirA family biotin operon repressor/biotin-[acetyl-CoA-carboxylase] ligase
MAGAATFPPLMAGLQVEGAIDPFQKACASAALGCDGGTVVYNLGSSDLRAAIVFAPEVPLADAIAMLPLCGVGFQNALGALAPPEVAVHLEWPGAIRINGARCGTLRVAASTDDPAMEPAWLVVGLELALWPRSDNPGDTPDETALYAEGCADVDALQLLESFARHTLVWINKWDNDGVAPIHTDWRGMAHGIGEEFTHKSQSGTFLGVDEQFGMLLRHDGGTDLIPMTELLES